MESSLQDELQKFRDSIGQVFQGIQPLLNGLQKQLAKTGQSTALNLDMYSIAEGWKRFEAGASEQFQVLAEHGWFISWWETPLASIYPLASLFREGKIDVGNRQLCKHFNDCLEGIEHHFEEYFEKRKRILRKAFAAHRDGDYELSIPVFLAQADGIGKEVIGTSIYSRKKSATNQIRDYIDAVARDQFERALLEVVLLDIPITASSGSPLLFQDTINRHEILHGVNTTYPSVEGSFKAISWLQYIAHFHEAKEIAVSRQNRSTE